MVQPAGFQIVGLSALRVPAAYLFRRSASGLAQPLELLEIMLWIFVREGIEGQLEATSGRCKARFLQDHVVILLSFGSYLFALFSVNFELQSRFEAQSGKKRISVPGQDGLAPGFLNLSAGSLVFEAIED